jgi:hypothetical protein
MLGIRDYFTDSLISGAYHLIKLLMESLDKKPKSLPLLDDRDYPINLLRQRMIRGTATDLDELREKAMENAVIMDLAIGGSTNSTLHLPAIAHELGFSLPLSRFNDFNRKIPTLLAIWPNGSHDIVDLRAGPGFWIRRPTRFGRSGRRSSGRERSS